MKEEIKELFVDDGELIVYYKDGSFQTFDTLTEDVLDYITNLQEENKNLKLSLKNRIKYSEDLDEKILRIDKAIEYITEDDIFYYGDELYDSYQEIINILKGEDK